MRGRSNGALPGQDERATQTLPLRGRSDGLQSSTATTIRALTLALEHLADDEAVLHDQLAAAHASLTGWRLLAREAIHALHARELELAQARRRYALLLDEYRRLRAERRKEAA